MDTLQITKEAAQKAHENAKNSGKELLENLFGKKVFQKNIMDRIKSIDDVIKGLGNNDSDVLDYLELQKLDIADHILANQQLVIITKALNEGWTPDWDNGQWDKWFNWFYGGSSSSGRFSFSFSDYQYSFSLCGSRLCFKSKELAQYAAKQFLDTYKRAFTI
ncbi:hypothetical protein SAMN05660477_00391 [Soonwooa buanensis]|uniref:Uncharacterized protein n=1 Tax=Soonwooa buanensis TaxID=619805 RepID=A0A1T5CVY0_9FLAO|nr:hypothetical protein [Soonwooa buanensis]SKB63486.1 hypothetical protein SAMN05660477_00391 [Soonwooa buanensis]